MTGLNAVTQGRSDAEKIENQITDLKLGLVLNFGQELLINGLSRVVNNL